MDFVSEKWDREIVPQLSTYIKIPNKSPMFDPNWVERGYMDEAMSLLETWVREQPISGMQVERIQLPGRTPLLFIEIPGKGDETVLLYGHMDKQPEMVGWNVDLAPWTPVLSGDKLYGRGGADDGYATYASLTAIMALKERGLDHSRCVVLIEGCEESGSYDLPFYINHLASRIGTPSLVVCLDSGCGNYDQLWLTTSLRGLAGGTLRVRVLEEGVHSGDASGVVPSSFRVLRQLLDRIEDPATGRILIDPLYVDIPGERVDQAKEASQVLGTAIYDKFPFLPGMHPMGQDLSDLVLNRTWRPTLSVTGADGLPSLTDAGNVLRPYTSVKLSVRLPPTMDGERASRLLKEALEKDPPYGARVEFEVEKSATGWAAPATASWLRESVNEASRQYFGPRAAAMGEGGTIPFMNMLQERFPAAQFVVTGLLGPKSNAHGPNEFLHIPTGKKLTASMAKVIHEHYVNRGGTQAEADAAAAAG
ncbi:MAG: M20 family metallopeptidase [Rhodanobacteraceae bacterium]|nr:M20 family metallopeptidase [Rhodanobacteraceae bacterium]